MKIKPHNMLFIVVFVMICVSSCVTRPPKDLNNICSIFKQNPSWYRETKDVERRWKVPIAVQMAIMYQESKFDARAEPPRTKLFRVIPWKRPSSAYGYAQALNGTWDQYKHSKGWLWSARGRFSDGADFIGWYANEANKKAKISRTDVYSLYLAYHEGIGGYQRKTYLNKAWLLSVAHKVKEKSQKYARQLGRCSHF